MEAMPASLLVRAGSRARSSKDLHNQSGMFPRHSVVLSFGQRPARPFAWPDAHSIAGRSAMSATLRVATLLGTLALGACAVGPPAGPSVAALPGKDKSLEAFQQDDAACRQYAAQTLGGVSPADAANQSMANSAVAGTLLGAAAGAAIGAAAGNPAAGAAIGAGSGLVIGGAEGANASAISGASFQRRYDIAYAQCMSSKGNIAPAVASRPAPPPVAAYPAYPAYPYPAYYYPYPYYPYPYAYPGYVHVGVGWGWHHWR